MALKASEVLKRVVLYLVKMRRATILSQRRMTKPQKTTKVVFLMLRVSRKTQECTKPAVKPMVIPLSIFFLWKLNPECEALFQFPRRNWKPSDNVWYENRPLGINKLSAMMKDISSAAGLSRIYTNHPVRATAITLWANAGLTNREIMAISGHRSESSLQSYHNMPSVQQLRKCSNVLTVALGDDRVQATADQLVGNERKASTTTAASSIRQHGNFFHSTEHSCVQPDVQFMHDWQRPRLQLQAVNE